MNTISDMNDIFNIDNNKVENDILYIKKHFKYGLKYLLSNFLEQNEDVHSIDLNFSLNHIDGSFYYYVNNNIGLSSEFIEKNQIDSMLKVEAIAASYNNKFSSSSDFKNIWLKPFHFNFDSLHKLLNDHKDEETYFNFTIERNYASENTDFNNIQFEEFNNKINLIQDIFKKVSNCLFIGHEIVSEKQPWEIHYYKNKNFCLLQEEEFDFCDKRYQLPDFMNKALQLYFIFSDTQEIIITKNDNQLYDKLIISDQESLQTLKDKYLLDYSFKNSTILTPNKKRF
ncbi:TPA: hypothetical protein NV714_000156 [Escherichia coli]|nr:hypothetical protein [Escherichia coli]